MLRLYSDGTGATFDDYFVDDFALGCTGVDSDGDGIPVPADCDDADPGLTFEC